MSWEAWVTCALVVLVLVGLGRRLAPVDVLMVGALTVIAVLSPLSDRFPAVKDLTLGFGNEAVLTVGVLYVIAAAQSRTGAIRRAALPWLGRPKSATAASVRLMLPVIGLSAFLNNTPVVAMLIPAVRDWCRSIRVSPSALMIPLSYASVLGGVCTLIGTSTTLIVQGMLREADLQPMGFFTIAVVGVPVALAGVLWMVLVGQRLLPARIPAIERMADPRQYSVEMRVEPGGPLAGKTVEGAGLRHLPGLFLAEVRRDGTTIPAPGPDQELADDDRLIFVGAVKGVVELQRIPGLRPAEDQVFRLAGPRSDRVFVEAVVGDTFPALGRTVRDGRFRDVYNAAIVAVHRNGELVSGRIGDIVLQPADTLLLEAHPSFVERYRDRRVFLLLAVVEGSSPDRSERAPLALGILGVMIAAAALEPLTGIGILPVALLAAGVLVATRCVTVREARASIEWSVLVSIGGALGLARALESTGAAGTLASGIIGLLAPYGPVAALAAVYLVTVVLTELVTNNAAAALVFPIAHATAAALDVGVMPFAITVAVAASCGFATPIGYQTHLMVYGAGGYRFGDFVKVGLALDLICMAVTLVVVPLAFGL